MSVSTDVDREGALGDWDTSRDAWKRTAEQRSGDRAARAYVQAAMAASVEGSGSQSRELLEKAIELDPREPSLLLSQLPEDLPPAEQLQVLNQLTSDDDEISGLIAARRMAAHLITPDLDAAKEDLREVRELLPGSALVPGLEISLAVQQARLDKLDQKALNRSSLDSAEALAITTRQQLLAEHRYSESARLLTLQAEIYTLLGDRPRASELLRQALPEERQTAEQRQGLADAAASRALDYGLALELLDGDSETPAALRIRFECIQELGTPTERDTAINELDRLVTERGDQATEAAFIRLAATVGPVDIPWSEDAAVFLRSGPHERAAVTAEAMFRLKHDGWDSVVEVLRPYGSTPWALSTLLRCALHKTADPKHAEEAALRVLAFGPGYEIRIDVARAFSRARRFDRAREVLISVARDPNAPDVARADAYSQLIHVVGGDLDDWSAAGVLFDEWVSLRPTDSRSYHWGPTIANRRKH